MANDLVPVRSTGGSVPALIDPQGRLLVREQLDQDIAGPSPMGARSISSGHPAQGLTPERLARLLREAEDGDATAYLELAEEMEEKDLHYLGIMGTRKRAVSQLPITVVSASDDPEDEADAQLVRDWLDRDMLQFELFDMLDAVGKGYSVTEIIWDTSSQPWLPVRLETRDPRWFEFDRIDGKTLRLRTEGGLQDLAAAKYLVHVHPAKTGTPIRGGLARAAAWAYLFRNYSIKDWNRFNEAYGLPLRIGRYESGTQDADIRKFLRYLASLSSDFAAVFPKSMEVETREAGVAGTALFQPLAVYFEQQMSKAVLGQTSTTDAVAGGLGGSQANVHNDVRGDIETADAGMLAGTLNRDLVPWIVSFNRARPNRKRFPRICIGRPDPVDVDTFLKAAKAGAEMGVPIAVSTFRERTGIPEPKPGEELLQAPPKNPPAEAPGALEGRDPAKTPPPPFLEGSYRRSRRDPERGATAARQVEQEADAIAFATEEALGDWEQMLSPVIAPIDKLIGDATSLEQIRDQLAGMLDGMDPAAIVDMLARATFSARLAGDADIGRGA